MSRTAAVVAVLGLCVGSVLVHSALSAPHQARPYVEESAQITKRGLTDLDAYAMLAELTGRIGARLSGSPEAAKAVAWGQQTMTRLGFENVHLEPCRVPHWVRGKGERAALYSAGESETPLAICALGGSVATPKNGVTGEVIEVHSLEEAAKLGDRAKGKIVFYNRPFDPTLINTFEAYGRAVDQRYAGASVAAKVGAVAALVRSMSTARDNAPHTGMMAYAPDVPKIPVAAVSILGAETLSDRLKRDPHARVHLVLSCRTLPDVDSANVVGELVGTEKPNEVVLMGGHLDSWDLGRGAHDDGAGCAQSLEALSLLKRSGLRPNRTIRVVLFMNEENGARGAQAYAAAPRPASERHIAAIESDSGGFAPRGFGVTANTARRAKIAGWAYLLEPLGADRFSPYGEGTDIEPLGAKDKNTALIGLEPESQRYFDYHHSLNDTLDKVNPRELELGAISMAILSYVLAQEGV